MTDNEKQFEDFIRQIKFDDTPDPNHRNKLEQNLLRALAKQTPRQIKIWRTIMKRPVTKLATAAAIIIIAVLGITILDKSTTPAWAIEDTAKVLEEFNAIYIDCKAAPSLKALEEGLDKEIVAVLGKILEENGTIPVEFWARANQKRTRSGNIRVEAAVGIVGFADETNTYIYDPNSSIVYVQEGCHIMISPWPSADYLLKLQEYTEDWQVMYGKDAATGRDYAFITCTIADQAQSMWVEIDLETKLPARIKIWHNIHREGTPAYDIQRIVFFNELPDEMFEFEIPEGATVIEK